MNRTHMIFGLALVALVILFMTSSSPFKVDGWLKEHGDFDWVRTPSWLIRADDLGVAPDKHLQTFLFGHLPQMVAIENPTTKKRLLMTNKGVPTVGPATAKNLVDTLGEVWTITMVKTPNPKTFLFEIRSARPQGEWLGRNPADTDVAVDKTSPGTFWIIEKAPGGADTYYIRSADRAKTLDKKSSIRYLAVDKTGLGLIEDKKSPNAVWKFSRIANKKATPKPTARPTIVTTRPTIVTTRPGTVIARPAIVTTRPAIVTTRPGVVTTRPAIVTTRPAAR